MNAGTSAEATSRHGGTLPEMAMAASTETLETTKTTPTAAAAATHEWTSVTSTGRPASTARNVTSASVVSAENRHRLKKILSGGRLRTIMTSAAAASRTTSSVPGATRNRPKTRGSSDAEIECVCRRNSRSEEHTSELQSHVNLVCRLLLEKKKITI